jgi:serine O-acetyltransferase
MEVTHKTLPGVHPETKSKPLNLIQHIAEDINATLERDPAARNWFEVLTSYSGLHATWSHRISHWFWIHKMRLFARWLSQLTRHFTGIEIHPGATIGRRFFIDHGMGVVIGETSQIGDDVTLYHGVTLGGVSLEKGKRHPTLEDGVVVGAGAKVLGNITIGQGSRIGANAVVVKSVPENSVVVGVPGQVIQYRKRTAGQGPDLDHGNMPDAIHDAVHDLLQRVGELEAQLHVHSPNTQSITITDDGNWVENMYEI